MNENQLTTLWVGSFRYHLGRKTAAVSDFCDLLIQEWNSLPDECRNLIKRDLNEAFERDDHSRESGVRMFLPLGMDCDRANWQRVKKYIND